MVNEIKNTLTIHARFNRKMNNKLPEIRFFLCIANFKDSKEIMMTSDSETEYKYSSSNYVPVNAAYVSQCPEGELRCVNGHCITISQLCDKVNQMTIRPLLNQ